MPLQNYQTSYPQKLAGQCGKLKCCINYEAAAYIDAQNNLPRVHEPLQLEDGEAFLHKTDILRGIMWFSYDAHNMANMISLNADQVRSIIEQNRKGKKAPSLLESREKEKSPEFFSAAGEESISRFDEAKTPRKKGNKNRKGKKKQQGCTCFHIY